MISKMLMIKHPLAQGIEQWFSGTMLSGVRIPPGVFYALGRALE